MTATRSRHPCRRPRRAAVSPAMLGLLALLVAAVVAVGVIALTRPGKPGRAAPPPTQEEIDARLGELQQSFQAVLQEDLDPARLEARALLFTEDHPDQAGGRVLLAQVRMKMQRWKGAYSAWGVAIGLEPGASQYREMAGVCAAKLGRFEAARGHYEDAVEIGGDRTNNEVLNALGRLYLSLQMPGPAEETFTRALDAPAPGGKTNWKHEACSGLADTAFVKGDHDAALKLIDRAIRLSRADSAADAAGYHIQKARLLMDMGRDEQAKAMLIQTWRAYERAQWRIESARLRARLYERAEQLDSAVNHITLVTNMVQADPDRDDVRLADLFALLGTWQAKAGQADAARTSLHNLRTLSPDHPQIEAIQAALNQ